MHALIRSMSDWLWGWPMLVLFLGTGVYLIFRLRVVQVRSFLPGVRALLRKSDSEEGEISPFAALMTAVGGIVGNGNIAGVATAITLGGPGALFWMWISGVVGMGTMFAESTLGVRYRRRDSRGQWVGGPMYYIRDRLGWPRVAAFFAVGLALKTMLATTSVQSSSIASVVSVQLGWRPWIVCSILALVTGVAILGGVRQIARISQVLAPFMGLLYLSGATVVLVIFRHELPGAISLVVSHAFSPIAATGGFVGAGVSQAFRFGLARGVYSNEAGTGSVPIAHASARTNDPVRQGNVAMLGVFLDTLVVCSATGLVLVASGVWSSGQDSAALTAAAFSAGLGPTGGWVVMGASLLFGLSTLISWAFYGEQAAAYLFGAGARAPYRALYCVAIMGGSLATVRTIWAWADLLNGLMAIPNLLAVLFLAGELARGRGARSGATS